MSKWMVKYKLHGKETPWYVESPGLFTFDGWRYGVSFDDNNCYIPVDVEKLDEKEFKIFIRTQKIIKFDPANISSRVEATNEEKELLVDKYTEGKVKKDRNE